MSSSVVAVVAAISLFGIGSWTSGLSKNSCKTTYEEDSFSPSLKLVTNTNANAITNTKKKGSCSFADVTWKECDKQATKVLQMNRTNLQTSKLTHRLYVLCEPNAQNSLQVKALFCAIEGLCKSSLLKHFETPLLQLHKLSSFSLRDRERILSSSTSSSIFRFAFVQHPFARSFQLFHNVTNHRNPHYTSSYGEFMARLRKLPYRPSDRELNTISYRMFLALLNRRRQLEQLDAHRLPLPFVYDERDHERDDERDDIFEDQATICSIPFVEYSFIANMETFARDLHFVHQRLGFRSSSTPHCPLTEVSTSLHQTFSDSTIRHKATRLFQKDLNNFQYAPNAI